MQTEEGQTLQYKRTTEKRGGSCQSLRCFIKKHTGEMAHMDCKLPSLSQAQNRTGPYRYLFVAVDGFVRRLSAAIMPSMF